jgi:hypothetical protein
MPDDVRRARRVRAAADRVQRTGRFLANPHRCASHPDRHSAGAQYSCSNPCQHANSTGHTHRQPDTSPDTNCVRDGDEHPDSHAITHARTNVNAGTHPNRCAAPDRDTHRHP